MNSRLNTLLLSHIGLSTALAGLALIVHVTELLLLGTVTSHGSTNGTESTLGTVLHTTSPVLELALGLLLLASSVLLSSSTAQVLVANHVTNGFLGRADGLVPRAGGSVRVVLGDSAGVRVCGKVAELSGGVGCFILGLGLLLRNFTLVLIYVSPCL